MRNPLNSPTAGLEIEMRVERTGSYVSGKMGGHRKRFLGNDLCWIERRAKARPEIATKELRYLLTGWSCRVVRDHGTVYQMGARVLFAFRFSNYASSLPGSPIEMEAQNETFPEYFG